MAALAIPLLGFLIWIGSMALVLLYHERKGSNEMPDGLLGLMFFVALPLSFMVAGALLRAMTTP